MRSPAGRRDAGARLKRDVDRLLRASACWDQPGRAATGDCLRLAPPLRPGPLALIAAGRRVLALAAAGLACGCASTARRRRAAAGADRADAVPHASTWSCSAPSRGSPIRAWAAPTGRAATAAPARCGAHAEIAHAQARACRPGPVTHGKAWIEMIHRYLAIGVGVLIIALRGARPGRSAGAAQRRRVRWWPAATLAWVCLQGAFGALTVTMKLYPAIVTAAPARRHGAAGAAVPRRPWPIARAAPARPARRCLRALAAGARSRCCWLQIALGGWVSTNYAVLACTRLPDLPGQLVAGDGLRAWLRRCGASSGRTARRRAHLPFAALTAIHYAHRLFAYVVLRGAGWLRGWRLRRARPLRRRARWIGGLALWQFATRPVERRARLAARRRRGAHRPAPRRWWCADLGAVRKPPAVSCATVLRPGHELDAMMPHAGSAASPRTAPSRCAPVLRADQAARGAADRVLRA